MSILQPQSWSSYNAPLDSVTFDVQDYAIGGKMVRVSASMSDDFSHMLMTDQQAREKVKEDLAMQMAKIMLENKLIEINQMSNPATMGITVVARCYLAPNDQIKILRTMVR
jgi:hypothetical protein